MHSPGDLAQELEPFCAEPDMTKPSVLIQALLESSDFGHVFRPVGKVTQVLRHSHPVRRSAVRGLPHSELHKALEHH